jgi:molecular chaperone GrpE
MDEKHRIEIETAEDETAEEEAAEEESTETLSDEDLDIGAAIDEAVHAVEVAAQRRRPPTSGNGGAAGPEASGPEEVEIERLRAEINALKDHSLRTLADFDNYRKRVQRERDDERRYAGVELLREVLGIVDNLDRALAAEGSLEDLKLGVELIRRQVGDLLERSGVTRVEALEREFDPSVHEAVSRVEDPRIEHATVIEEFQPGYLLHERLLRPAIVRVAVPARADADTTAGRPTEPDGSQEAAN